jgi:protein AIR1/2
MTGPFYNPDEQPSAVQRAPRDWESADHVPDGWGFNAPSNVGQQGRRKEKARMEERARLADDDGDDWFGGRPDARGLPKKPAFSFNGGARDRDRDRDRDRHSSNGRHYEPERRDSERSRSHHGDDGRSDGLSIKGASKRSLSDRLTEPDSRGEERYNSRSRKDDRRENGRRESDRRQSRRDNDYRDDGRRDGYRHQESRPSQREREDGFRPRYTGGYGR